MKSLLTIFFFMTTISTSYAYVGNINCKDENGKTRMSFHVDTNETDAVPQCVTEVRIDDQIVPVSIGNFPDDGPFFDGKNASGQYFTAQLKLGMKAFMVGYTTEAIVQDVTTTLHCR